MEKTITIKEGKSYTLLGTYHDAGHDRLLIYLHGGGLIFGQRDDLPDEYMTELTKHFNVLAADYRLAPESTLNDILDDIDTIYEAAQRLNQNIYVMGRSAGGYLAFMLANKHKVEGIIDFYGYHHFNHPSFSGLPVNQQHVKALLTDDLMKLKGNGITTNESPTPRYLLYLYYRNRGLWQEVLQLDEHHALTAQELSRMPRTFIAHTQNDPDVPYDYAKELEESIPECKVVTIDSDAHDFDQNVTADTIQLYGEACDYVTNTKGERI